MRQAGSSVLPTLPDQGDKLGEGGDERVDGDIGRNMGREGRVEPLQSLRARYQVIGYHSAGFASLAGETTSCSISS